MTGNSTISRIDVLIIFLCYLNMNKSEAEKRKQNNKMCVCECFTSYRTLQTIIRDKM